ncbi:hypothetical protein [Gluconobacter japonicus]|uniref:hypothetical protein n=1 Tax=Gluconobacter japonicus TaxID=376620 RepID=UPI0039E782CE
MSQTLRSFLAQRESEIKEQLKKLRLELKDIQRAHEALNPCIDAAQEDSQNNARGKKVTIKEMILSVLTDFSDGLNAIVIGEQIHKKFNKEFERSSISPQLSRLKKEGLVSLSGDIWVLIRNNACEANLIENGTAEAAPEAEEAPTSSDESNDDLN